MAIQSTNGATVITGEHINTYRLLTLRMGLKAEMRGMRLTRGRSCFAIVKEEFGLKGNKQKVFEQFEALLEKLKSQGGAA